MAAMRRLSHGWRAGLLASVLLVSFTACAEPDAPREEARLKSRPTEEAQAVQARATPGPLKEVPRGYSGPLPPLPDVPYAPARPMDVTRAVYAFAARNPEVLHYVPCFCGCEHHGHQGNDECFVASRDAGGRPRWEMHGYV
jgi:hypothetical protein